MIPIEIGVLPYLTFLSFRSNLLSGPVPEELGACKTLQQLDISDNFLSVSPHPTPHPTPDTRHLTPYINEPQILGLS